MVVDTDSGSQLKKRNRKARVNYIDTSDEEPRRKTQRRTESKSRSTSSPSNKPTKKPSDVKQLIRELEPEDNKEATEASKISILRSDRGKFDDELNRGLPIGYTAADSSSHVKPTQRYFHNSGLAPGFQTLNWIPL